jgi:predicted alpha/beta superfamily hydrolase
MAMDGETRRVIVVGIGYEPQGHGDEEEQRFTRLRCRDLTPTVERNDTWRVAVGHPERVSGDSGRAENFIQVIERDVKPFIEAHYRIDREDQTLAGFSFGALFALHVLFKHPELFRRYVIGSPSLWWDGGVVFRYEEEFAKNHLDLNKAVFLSIGSLEESEPWQSFNMVKNLKLLAERLASRNYPALKLESLILENETHPSGAAASFIKGLRWVLRQSA